MLNKEQIMELRKPFRADQIKWKIQTQPKDASKLEGWGVVVSYLDARDVAERLDVATDGNWTDDYNLFGKALECSLTVNGVARKDVGEADSAKELYSDAFKRAAVKFGVGAFLYRMPGVMAKLTRKDARKPWTLSDGAKASLRGIAEAVAGGKAPAPRYADLMLLSDYQAPETMAAEDEAPAAPAVAPQKAQQPAPRPNTAPAAAPADSEPLGNEKGARLHAQLGALLKGTRHEKMTHPAFAATITGREVSGLSELTRAESVKVYNAAKMENEALAQAS